MRRAFLAIVALLGVAAQEERRTLDAYLDAEWTRSGLKPAPLCDDATFLRRITLDLAGSLPDPEEIRAFLKSSRKDKRAARIDELLAGPKSAEYFAYLWIQWLTGHDIENRDLQRLDLGALAHWLKEAWAKDLPYDDWLRAFLSSTGALAENPPANFLAKHLVPGDPPAAAASAVARLFLGRDIRCAQCHDHPFDTLSQEDFWSFAAFLRPFRVRDGALVLEPVSRPARLRDDLGERFESARFLDGRLPAATEPPGPALARLILTQEGDAAARAIVDRHWKLLFGRSLVPGRNGKGNPELLRLLVDLFLKRRGSLKEFVRTIVSSRAYQLTSEGPETARREYAVGPLKMMNTVQFLRTWNHALALDVYYRQIFEKDPAKAPFLRDPDTFWIGQSMNAKELLFPKGRDPEEVLSSGTDRLAIKLMNNRDLQLLMISQFGLVRKVMKQSEDPARRIEELYLLMVSRPPTPREKARLLEYVKTFSNPYHAYTDVFWMLFNHSEFVFVG